MPLIFINQSEALHILITWHLLECRFLVIYIMQQKRVVHMLQGLGAQGRLIKQPSHMEELALIMPEVMYLSV